MLRPALDLWRGPALGEFADRPFAAAEAMRLEELREAALFDDSARQRAGRCLRLQGSLPPGRRLSWGITPGDWAAGLDGGYRLPLRCDRVGLERDWRRCTISPAPGWVRRKIRVDRSRMALKSLAS